MHEFIPAGDIEKKHRLEVSQLCDREINTVGNIQIGEEKHISCACMILLNAERQESGTCLSNGGAPLLLFTLFIAASCRKTTDTRFRLMKYEESEDV